MVSGVDAGSVTITVSTTFKSNTYSNSVSVTIVAAVSTPPESTPQIEITNPIKTLKKGSSFDFDHEFTDDTGEENNSVVSWVSKSTTIATINANGVAKAIEIGKVVIEVSVTFKGVAYKDTVEFDVVIDPELRIVNEVVTLEIDDTHTFELEFKDEKGMTVSSGQEFNWSHPDDTYQFATIDTNGTIQGVKEGKVPITVTTEYKGVSYSYETTVCIVKQDAPNPKVTILDITSGDHLPVDGKILTAKKGQTFKMSYQMFVCGESIGRHFVKWTSSDASFVNVRERGDHYFITVLKDGHVGNQTTYIEVKITYQGKEFISYVDFRAR